MQLHYGIYFRLISPVACMWVYVGVDCVCVVGGIRDMSDFGSYFFVSVCFIGLSMLFLFSLCNCASNVFY